MNKEIEKQYTKDKYNLDEERIEELIEFERNVKERGIEPNKVPLISISWLRNISTYTNAVSGTVRDIEPGEAKTIIIRYEVAGDDYTTQLEVHSNTLVNLLTYVGIEDGRFMNLRGRKVPVKKDSDNRYQLNVPTNVSLAASLVFRLRQIIIRMGLLKYDQNTIKLREGTKIIPLVLALPTLLFVISVFGGDAPFDVGLVGAISITLALMFSTVMTIAGIFNAASYICNIWFKKGFNFWKYFSPFQ